MKLLSKSQVASDNANLRKKQIDEGVAVARRVDEMRRLLSDLELAKKAFIENQVKELEAATSHLYKKKEGLEELINSLKAEREELRKPLDEEWEKLKDEQFILSQNTKALEIRETELNDRDFQLSEKELGVSKKEERITILLGEMEVNTQESREDKDRASQVLMEAQSKATKIDEEIAEKRKEIQVEEEKIRFDRQGIEQVARNNEIRKAELDRREKQIKDRYQTLLREEQRRGKR